MSSPRSLQTQNTQRSGIREQGQHVAQRQHLPGRVPALRKLVQGKAAAEVEADLALSTLAQGQPSGLQFGTNGAFRFSQQQSLVGLEKSEALAIKEMQQMMGKTKRV